MTDPAEEQPQALYHDDGGAATVDELRERLNDPAVQQLLADLDAAEDEPDEERSEKA